MSRVADIAVPKVLMFATQARARLRFVPWRYRKMMAKGRLATVSAKTAAANARAMSSGTPQAYARPVVAARAHTMRAMAPQRFEWETLPDSALLDWRLRDLGVRIEGTWIEECVDELYGELERRQLPFRPHMWL